MREDEMVGWHHQLNGREFGWAPGVGDRQGGLACCSPRGCKESDTTERLNCTEVVRMCRSQIPCGINPEYSLEGLMLKLKNQ